MPKTTAYVSELFRSMPEHTGHLAIYISESRCDIGICSSTSVLTFLQSYQRQENQFPDAFIQSVFRNHQELFAQNFDEVSIGIETANFTILPNWVNAEKETVMELITDSPTRVSFSQRIQSVNAQFMYSLPLPLKEVLRATFPRFQQFHCLPFAIEHCMSNKEDAYLVLDEAHMDCVVKKGEKLVSATRQQRNNDEDMLYFLLAALKDAEIMPEEASVAVSGSIKKHSDSFQLLTDYVKDVNLSVTTGKVTVRPDFEQPLQVYQYLLNLLNANY